MYTSDDDTLVLASVSLEDPYMPLDECFASIERAADAELEAVFMEDLESQVRDFVELAA